jgi:hypothetical protein
MTNSPGSDEERLIRLLAIQHQDDDGGEEEINIGLECTQNDKSHYMSQKIKFTSCLLVCAVYRKTKDCNVGVLNKH